MARGSGEKRKLDARHLEAQAKVDDAVDQMNANNQHSSLLESLDAITKNEGHVFEQMIARLPPYLLVRQMVWLRQYERGKAYG